MCWGFELLAGPWVKDKMDNDNNKTKPGANALKTRFREALRNCFTKRKDSFESERAVGNPDELNILHKK